MKRLKLMRIRVKQVTQGRNDRRNDKGRVVHGWIKTSTVKEPYPVSIGSVLKEKGKERSGRN